MGAAAGWERGESANVMVSVGARRRHHRLPPTKGGTSARPAGPARKLGYLNSAPGGSGHDRLWPIASLTAVQRYVRSWRYTGSGRRKVKPTRLTQPGVRQEAGKE